MNGNDELVTIATVGKPRGLNGEFHIIQITDIPEQRFVKDNIVTINSTEYVIQNSRVLQGEYCLKLQGIGEPEQVNELKGMEILAQEIEEEGLYYPDQLIGKVVLDKNKVIGTVKEVNIQPFQSQLILDTGTVIPFVDEWIEQVTDDTIMLKHWDTDEN
jgi:16S rRNA processing protein RimM